MNLIKQKQRYTVMINNKIIYGLLILFVGFAMSLNSATAQVTGEQEGQMQNNVEGKVVDAETGQSISDVTVQIEGMNKEATTDENGEFSFENLEGSQETTEGGMGEQQNPNEVTFTIDHEGYQQFSKTLQWDELRQQGQQGQQGQQRQQGQQGQENNQLTFELEPEQGQG